MDIFDSIGQGIISRLSSRKSDLHVYFFLRLDGGAPKSTTQYLNFLSE